MRRGAADSMDVAHMDPLTNDAFSEANSACWETINGARRALLSHLPAYYLEPKR